MSNHKDRIGKSRAGVFLESLGDVSKPLLKVAGSLTGIEALNVLSDSITTSTQLSNEQKEKALNLLKIDLEETSKRWEHDSKSDSWLPKNIRPLTLAYTMFVVSLFCVLDSLELMDVKDHWVSLFSSLLLTIVVAYFGSRGAEKIIKK